MLMRYVIIVMPLDVLNVARVSVYFDVPKIRRNGAMSNLDYSPIVILLQHAEG